MIGTVERALTMTASILTRSPGTTYDDFGRVVPGAETSTEVRCRIYPQASREIVDGRDTVLDAWRIVLPRGTPLSAGDVIEHDGRTFRVEGEPARIVSPRHGEIGVEAALTATTEVAR